VFDAEYKKLLAKDYNAGIAKKFKLTIMTVLTRNDPNDKLKEVLDPQDDIEYLCITDRMDLKSSTWKIIDLRMETCQEALKWKYPKFHPFEFASSDICMHVDSTI